MIFSRSTKAKYHFFPLLPYSSCVCHMVVPFLDINPNCIESIFTFSLILHSNTRSLTFFACSSNCIALYEPRSTPLTSGHQGQGFSPEPLPNYTEKSTIPHSPQSSSAIITSDKISAGLAALSLLRILRAFKISFHLITSQGFPTFSQGVALSHVFSSAVNS